MSFLRLITFSSLFFVLGLYIGHYKPVFFLASFNHFKNLLNTDLFSDSIHRLENSFLNRSCDENTQFSFFTAGHTYGYHGIDYQGLYEPFMNSVLSQRCPMKLGFLLGDTVNKQSRREMGFLQRDLAKLSADLDLDHIYIAPGNHDVGVGPYSAERDIFSENFGKGFRSFVFKNNLFIILDAGLDGWNISGEQLNMLKRLESSNKQYKNIFIFSHQLIWLKANNEFKGLIPNDLSEKGGLEINFWTEVFPILKNLKGRKFFISGDVGLFRNGSEFFYNKYDDFNFIATGMGSGSRDNYLIFHINEGKPNVEFITF